jgi:uncharacterized protein YuzE
MRIEISIDSAANSAYIRLQDKPVATSKIVNDDVVIDLDDMNIAVGIEVLDLEAELPFTELTSKFHVHSDTVELLRKLRPSISGFMSGYSSEASNQMRNRVGSPQLTS